MELHAAAVSHVGNVRENNEDNYYLQGQIRQDTGLLYSRACGSFGAEEPLLFAVADGMGGEACGERASLLAVEALAPCAGGDAVQTSMQSIRCANHAVCRESAGIGRRMGTTLAALYLADGRAVACNVGDSRVYLCRGGRLERLSVDHNQAQALVDLGLLTPEQAAHHPGRHALTQFIGIPPEQMVIQPHFSEMRTAEPGDVFLLCSDGLTDGVAEEQILSALRSGTAAEQADALVGLARSGGGRDNITVLIVQVKA